MRGSSARATPRELFEVVIVDDGSCEPLAAPVTPLEVRVVRQARRGFGLARARNAGVRAAAHDILVFIDGDIIAEADLIAAHARWHHAVSDALTQGFCAWVSVEGVGAAAVRERTGSVAALFEDRARDAPWIERHMARTGDLTSCRGDLFRAVTGHNFAIARAFFEEVGGFDESFTRYGGEDTEFGYRVQMRGGLLVPVREAFGWHQGRWWQGRAGKERERKGQAGKLAALIADPGFRRSAPDAASGIPRHVVSIEAGDAPVERALETARALLGDPEDDIAVWIGAARGGEARWEALRGPAADPRLHVGGTGTALDAFPVSPFHIALPAEAAPVRGLVGRLRGALGEAASASAVLGDGSRVAIARAWALHRARRAGGSAADYGAARRISALRLAVAGWVPGLRRRTRRGRGVWAAAARVWAEGRHVRGVRTGWRFLAWLAGGFRWWLRRGGGWAATPAPGAARGAAADAGLGVEIVAIGERARAVFRASSRVACRVDGRGVDAVLADTAAQAAGIEAPVVVLEAEPALAVPAFDPAVHNPVGWVREVEPRVAALGPTRLLPPGRERRCTLAAEDRGALAHCHRLEDVAAFHAGATERAGTLARLAACGVPVHVADRDPVLADLLGAELHGLMTGAAPGADAGSREALSIAQRRAALRGHSLRARARQICAAAGAGAPGPALVSVLLATRRPGRLAAAVANVARQRYPNVELVLALHGPGFAPGAEERAARGFPHALTVLRLDEAVPLGSVLNAATEVARGGLLAKMDDDDLYGPEHLWDVVLAAEYSGAGLVGKFPATVYLARLDRTVRARGVRSETWSRSITGGTMLVSREALAGAGGWRAVPRHVDAGLVEDVLGSGGAVYRTHDAGYLMVRHGDRHTWEADDAAFAVEAEAVRAGWHPALAGIGATDAVRGPIGAGAARCVARGGRRGAR